MSQVGVEVLLITGRTIRQGRGLEVGKLSDDYFDAVNYCELDATTLSALGVNEGDPILIETQEGSVIVFAKLGRGLEPGTAFMPYGPYANMLISSDTWQTGMPGFKETRVKIFRAKGKQVPSVREMLAQILEGK